MRLRWRRRWSAPVRRGSWWRGRGEPLAAAPAGGARPDGGAAVPYEQAPFTPWPGRDPDMHAAAARLADQAGLTRAAQEEFAVESHARARAADLSAEIVALEGVARDAFARGLTAAVAARAKAVAGTVSAATAAVAADAAAFVVVASAGIARGRGLRIAGAATLGADPEQPGLAPVPAIAAALARAGIAPGDLARAEIMEAYAVQALACIEGAGLDPGIVNRKGGALARGHPIGASGAILAVRLFHDLTAGHGLAAIASAGGIGAALVLAAG